MNLLQNSVVSFLVNSFATDWGGDRVRFGPTSVPRRYGRSTESPPYLPEPKEGRGSRNRTH